MGSLLSPELSLEMFVPRTITDLLKEVSMIGDAAVKGARVGGFLNELEEELRKIDAFKRELPLCMLLLNDAIRILREESRQCEASSSKPVLEEFIPLKRNCDGDGDDGEEMRSIRNEKDSRDKKHWMSSVQLWSSDNGIGFDKIQNLKPEPKINKNENQDRLEAYKSRSAARSFLPFKPYSGLPRKEDCNREELAAPGLSLVTPGIKNFKEESNSTDSRSSCHRVVSTSAPNSHSDLRNGPQQPSQQSSSRKQRRCWAPDLHRRFLNALQQLGGSQAATPKQIRELMQVDGLTNDEVKSHLQKYRLHARRTSPSSTATTPANQSVVALGGCSWMGQDQYGDSTKSSSQSGSPQGPLQLAGHTGGTSTTGGDSMEDDEDAKSEGYSSWKTHPQCKIHRSGTGDDV